MGAKLRRCLPAVSQGFLDDDELWSACCSCGWRHTERLPYWNAVAKAQWHGDQNDSEPQS